MKTFSAKKETVQQDWYVVDAAGQTLGRLASALATRLRGKHKPEYTSHVDTGDYIVVINADKIAVTGNKGKNKMYHNHSQYPGGLRSRCFNEVIQGSTPEEALKLAVKGMIPRNPLGRDMMRKLKVYAGMEHPHSAQQPAPLNLG
jgi:large subunit ribosomal protein L13